MALVWTNKTDGVDNVLAEDINSIAGAVNDLETEMDDKVSKEKTIAGLSLNTNITTSELQTALGFDEKADVSDVTYITGVQMPLLRSEMQGDISVVEAAKVDKEFGKGLSSNDYTIDEKSKLAAIPQDAEANVQSDWNQTVTDADDFIKK